MLAAAGLLAGCGGGGGASVPPPASQPAPPPAVDPTPIPPQVPPPPVAPPQPSFETAEVNRSNAVLSSRAVDAWRLGHEGQGVVVGVVDSGLGVANSEFAGRVHPASRDVTGNNRGFADDDGHGTAVAAVLAAARNGERTAGIAPLATLAVMRAETLGSCSTDDGCRFSDRSLATGVNEAVAAGARVINLSLGGSTAAPVMRDAVVRAAAAGVLIVVSAGNQGGTDPEPFAASLLAAGGGQVIVVGALGTGGGIADFSNRAGTAADRYMVALGQRVASIDHRGQTFLWSGTSIAAPQVSGAAALLLGAFPNLSPRDAGEILLSTADDLGAPGTDSFYGRGGLNIARAFAPQGATTLAGTRVPVSLSANAMLAGPMGDGARLGAALGRVRFQDRWGRDYLLDAGATLGVHRPAALAAGVLAPPARAQAIELAAGKTRLTLRTAGAWAGAPSGGCMAALVAPGPPLAPALWGQARPVVSLALAHGPLALHAGNAPRAAPTADEGEWRAEGARLGLGWAQGRWDIGVAHQTGERWLPPAARLGAIPGRQGRHETTLALARQHPGGLVGLELAWGGEQGSLAGSRMGPAFALTGASSLAWRLSAEQALGGGWAARLDAAEEHHRPRFGPGLVAGAGALVVRSGRLAVEGPLGGGRVALGGTLPPVVAEGRWLLAGGTTADLRPSGRETRLVARWAHGPLSLEARSRFDAWHVAGLEDHAATIRLTLPH